MRKSVVVIAEQVRAARAHLGLSQTELADAAGITRKSLYQLETASGDTQQSTANSVRRVLEAKGVLFIEDGDKAGILGPVGNVDADR